MPTRPPVVITGASSGIGAAYADRFARRGHDLVLVARNTERMESLASRLRRETGVAIDNIQADLTQAAELAVVEARLRADTRIGILVNNAGTALGGRFIEQTADDVARLVALNTTALLRLASAVAGLSLELDPTSVYVQAVLPAATRTEIWERAGADVNTMTGVMDAEELVDAALVGFDRREPVTMPPLPDEEQWNAFQAARQAMVPNTRQERAAARYRTVI